jgi:hypothetical protein
LLAADERKRAETNFRETKNVLFDGAIAPEAERSRALQVDPPARALIARERKKEKAMNEREERLRSVAAAVQNRVSGKLGDIWWAFMLRGAFAGVLGVCALIWPTPSFTILTRMIGLYCLADGLAALVGVLRTSDRGTYLLQPAVGLVVGGVLLFWPAPRCASCS